MLNLTYKRILFLALSSIFICLVTVLFFSIKVSADEKNYETYLIPDQGKEELVIYSDNYFKHASTEYDEHLSSLSVLMAKFSMNPGNPTSIDDKTWYDDQSDRVANVYDVLGFDKFEANEDYYARTGFKTMGVAVAHKKIDDFDLIACVVRSGGYFLEWENNVYLGTGEGSADYMHQGWYDAAIKTHQFIQQYVSKNGFNRKIKLWLSGYSRGGAVMNILGGLLDNAMKSGRSDIGQCYPGVQLYHDDLFVYTFEAPQGANINSKTVENPRNSMYNNIFNVVNPNDAVTKVPFERWGFTRYGIDKYITTEFFDPDNFSANREVFRKFYTGGFEGDRFEFRKLNLSRLIPVSIIDPISIGTAIGELIGEIINDGKVTATSEEPTKAYDANINQTLVLDDIASKIGSRKDYVDKYQPTMRLIMKEFFVDVGGVDGEPQISTLYAELILAAITDYVCLGYGAYILGFIITSNLTTAGPLIKLLKSVYGGDRPNDLVSFMYSAQFFGQNHDTDVTVDHVRAQDGYFIDEYNKANSTSVKKVPLLNDASFIRIHYEGYNDLKVWYKKDGKTTQVAEIDGSRVIPSSIDYCNKGVAVGYYHYYSSDEYMELFARTNVDVTAEVIRYSVKFRFPIKYQAYLYNTNDNTQKKKLGEGSDRVTFDSDTLKLSYKARS